MYGFSSTSKASLVLVSPFKNLNTQQKNQSNVS